MTDDRASPRHHGTASPGTYGIPRLLRNKAFQKRIDALKDRREALNYYAEHTRCPQCLKSEHVSQTCMGVLTSSGRDFEDNVNTATCHDPKCGWSGKVSDLLHPRVTVIHHLIDPDTGESYKKGNMKLTHKIPVGTLVELLPADDEEHAGVRLYVVEHNRDCDGTPLYAMSAKKSDIVAEREGFANRKWEHGWAEENLRVVE